MQKEFSFMKLAKPEEKKEISLEEKKELLDKSVDDFYISTVDVLRKRKVSDQDFLKLIKVIDNLNNALRSSDFDRMVYNETIERRLRVIDSKLDKILNSQVCS